MTKKSIHFLPSGLSVKVHRASSVLEVAIRGGVELSHSCGGMGRCTTCRVFVESCAEPLPERNELEQELADTRGFAVNERLACQLPPLKELVVRIPEILLSDLG